MGADGGGRKVGLLAAISDYPDYRWRILALAGMSVVAALFEAGAIVLVVPITEAIASDSESMSGRIEDLVGSAPSPERLLTLGIVLVVVTAVLKIGTLVAQVRAVRSIDLEGKRVAYRAYIHADARVQAGSASGRLQATMAWSNLHAQRAGYIVQTLRNLASVAVLIAGSIVVQPAGSVAIFVCGGAIFLLFRPLIRRSRDAAARATQAQVPHAEFIAESEAARTELRTFGAEEWATQTYEGLILDLTNARIRQQTIGLLISPLYQALVMLGIFGVLGLALSSDGLDIAAIGTVALLLLRSLSYGQGFQTSYQQLVDAGETSARFFEELNRLDEEQPGRGRTRRISAVSRIELDALDFSYGAGPVLRCVSFSAVAGERIGVVGPSGAGKSTLALVLLQLLRPSDGSYLVNGASAYDIELGDWTREVAFVPQRPTLLHGTVHDNISMFRPSLTRDDVVRAAEQAAIHDVIETLPDGYDTRLGASTRDFSGGQVQRLGVARVLAGSPSLVVLDEPTSALDSTSEDLIVRSLDELPDESISVVIAHRMSTLAGCTRIIVLEDGQVTHDGPSSTVALRSEWFSTHGIGVG